LAGLHSSFRRARRRPSGAHRSIPPIAFGRTLAADRRPRSGRRSAVFRGLPSLCFHVLRFVVRTERRIDHRAQSSAPGRLARLACEATKGPNGGFYHGGHRVSQSALLVASPLTARETLSQGRHLDPESVCGWTRRIISPRRQPWGSRREAAGARRVVPEPPWPLSPCFDGFVAVVGPNGEFYRRGRGGRRVPLLADRPR
jgi:hypothetical protein